jgi:hypothetical protein
VVFYGVSLKPCNAGSGYNPTLQILYCSTIFAEVIGASLVFIAHPETSQYLNVCRFFIGIFLGF